MRIKKDDTVIVITGKDKGKTGKVIESNAERRQSHRRRHQHADKACRSRPRKSLRRSSIMEGPLDISNVMYYDTKTKTCKQDWL